MSFKRNTNPALLILIYFDGFVAWAVILLGEIDSETWAVKCDFYNTAGPFVFIDHKIIVHLEVCAVLKQEVFSTRNLDGRFIQNKRLILEPFLQVFDAFEVFHKGYV